MAIEQEVIVQKLTDEGLNTALANGLTFEDEDIMNNWINDYKSGIPKSIESYTKEEIEELAKDPTFKGAKGLQGFVDKIRQSKPKIEPIKPIVPKVETPKPEPDPEIEALKAFKANYEAKEAAKELREKVNEHADGLEGRSLERVIKGLRTDATDDQIKAEIKAEKDYLISNGFKPNRSNGKRVYDSKNSASKKYADKNKKS